MHTEQIIKGLNKLKSGQQIDDAELRYRVCKEAKKAVEKQIPQKPITFTLDGVVAYKCGCGEIVYPVDCFCPFCGQALDWSEDV